jgi:DNA-binding transcriptional MerR regulator
MDKSADAYRTISEVADELDVPQHVLRFWETRFTHIRPLKRAGGRRFYRPQDVELLRAIKQLLYGEGYTIKGVQRILKEQGARAVAAASQSGADFASFAARDLPLLHQDAAWKEDRTESGFDQRALDADSLEFGRASPGGEESAAQPSAAPDADSLVLPDRPPAAALPARVVAGLRAALIDLEECERILEAVRRR